MNKNQTKCPICGRYVSKGLAEKYDNLKSDRDRLEKELEELKSRGFWARVFKK